MAIDSKPEALDKLERRLIQLKVEAEALKEENDDASKQRLHQLQQDIEPMARKHQDLNEIWQSEKAQRQGTTQLKEALEQAKIDMDAARRQGNLGKMSELQYGIIPKLEKQLILAADAPQKPTQLLHHRVNDEQIAEVLAKATGIPVNRMLEAEKQKLLHLETVIGQRVIGQSVAVTAIADAIRRSRAGLSPANRPIGSFLFLGPTGVGKTELAKALAEFLFNTEQAMVRIDMSEYMEKHAVSRLIGAPPGYVGYEQGGLLTEQVRRKPYAVILLDEIEKAHPEVFNILLQVLEDGRLTDGQGRTVDFANTVIIMTSNMGAELITHEAIANYPAMREAVLGRVGKHFRPELINRIDASVVFTPLSATEIRKIAKIQLRHLGDTLKQQQLDLEVTTAALNELTERGIDPLFGARPLKRCITQYFENPLAKALLDNRFKSGDTIKVDYQNQAFSFTTN